MKIELDSTEIETALKEFVRQRLGDWFKPDSFEITVASSYKLPSSISLVIFTKDAEVESL